MKKTLRPGVRLGLDIGKKRIGVAWCDGTSTLALPLDMLVNDKHIAEKIQNLIKKYEPIEVVVGLPVSLQSQVDISAQHTLQALTKLFALAPEMLIRCIDERFTTKIAQRKLHEIGKNEKKSRALIDKMSAVLILEEALDREQTNGFPPGETKTAIEWRK